jgi:hypothetical protein
MKRWLLVLLVLCPTTVYADLTGTAGFAIDLSSAGAGTDFTITFDPTEITGGITWDDGGEGSVIWSWNLAAGDPAITFGNGVVNISSGTLQQGGTAVSLAGHNHTGVYEPTDPNLTGLAAVNWVNGNFVRSTGTGGFAAVTANAGTDITADLEEEAHASEHAVGGGDAVFPADPGADRYLMWDDDPGQLVFVTIPGGGDMLRSTYDVSSDGHVDGNDVAVSAAWNGDVNAPSMNAVYDGFEPKVTEGSLSDSVVVSADIKDGTIAVADLVTAAKTFGINFVIDGGGSAIATGIKGDIEMPFDGTITSVRLLADQSGSIVVDIWEDTYANFPPTDADTSTSATPPTITTATKSEDTTLSSWDTTFSAGDILRINVDSCTTITRCTVSIRGTKG